MPLEPGTCLGPSEVLSPLGAGAMGDVYRARDTKLDRAVAIKILPEAFAHDPERVARFEREAKTPAALNHPNIAGIYGIEEGPAEAGRHALALVLELVEGPTLADRITSCAGSIGPGLSVDEALAISRQIAAAVEAAHEKGIIHRDLKPANIKVTPTGTVKGLDFGLAKMLEADRPTSPHSMSPTLSIQATYAGVILGTVGYMSPEQARGKPVDRRADLWAFGCVLYEMLTGRQVFGSADTVSDAVAAILTGEPDWSALPADVPAHVRRVLRRCLQKDPERRLHHIADARVELEDALGEPAATAAPATTERPASPARWRRALPWTVTTLALGAAVLTLWTRPPLPPSVSQAVLRLEVNLPAGVEPFTASPRPVAISPDGTRLAFIGVGGGSRQVYVRQFDGLEAVPLKGTDTVSSCFFSPDGQSIGFITGTGVLRTVSLAGGLVATPTETASFSFGAAWSVARDGALWQISQSGGTPQPLTMSGGARGDTLHAWPVALPDGKTILFGAASGEQWRIDALVLARGERRTVVERGTLPLYAGSGHLVFFRDGELLTAPFDAARLELTGPEARAIDNRPASPSGVPMVDVSSSGTVVYAPTTAVSRLVWVSRQGAEQVLHEGPRAYANPRLAPDGRRVLVEAGGLWIQDLARATFSRIASSDDVPAGFGSPIWAPDSRCIVYETSDVVRVQDVDGSGPAQVITGTSEFDFPGSITPDGETLVIPYSSQAASFDIYAVSLRNPGEIRPILNTAAYEGGPRLSPDGRWLTYISNESGRNEVYLRPFPGPGQRWQISTEGGTQAVGIRTGGKSSIATATR